MPARKPRGLKVLQGTHRADRDNPRAPIVPDGRAIAPDFLPTDARAYFGAFEGHLTALRVPSGAFQAFMAGAAVAYADVIQSTGTLEREGRTYETLTTTGARKIVTHPAWYQRQAALKTLKSYLTDLGLTPVAVEKLTAMPPAPPVNRFAGLRRAGPDRRPSA